MAQGTGLGESREHPAQERRVSKRRQPAGSAMARLYVSALIFLFEVLSIVGIFAIAPLTGRYVGDWYAIELMTLAVYCGTSLHGGAYMINTLRRASASAWCAIAASATTVATLMLFFYFFRTEQPVSRLTIVVAFAGLVAVLVTIRLVAASVIRRYLKASLITEIVITHGMRIDVEPGVTTIDATQIGLVPDLRDPMMLNRFAELVRGKDRVVIASTPDWRRSWSMLLKGANVQGEIIVDDIAPVGAIGLNRFDEHMTLQVSVGPLDLRQRIIKRAFDLIICIPALIIAAPLLLLTAAAIKLDSAGPVFFRQRRVGRGNAFFKIIKFRSMHNDRGDAEGRRSTARQDDRITRVGRIIRRISIDELPQILNVLGGSMSLVGPRPHALGSQAGESLFWDVDEHYWHRHVLKPGITGLAQVRGFRGSTHNRDDLVRRLQADLEYVAQWSLWRDITILAATVKVVVHENTY